MDELLVFRGNDLLGRYELFASEVVIGRGGHIALDSAYLSRLHALLSHAPGKGWVLTDLGSRNGSLLNGKTVNQDPLKNGDSIAIGELTLRCRFDGTGPRSRAPALAPKDDLEDTRAFDPAAVRAEKIINAIHPVMSTGTIAVAPPKAPPSRLSDRLSPAPPPPPPPPSISRPPVAAPKPAASAPAVPAVPAAPAPAPDTSKPAEAPKPVEAKSPEAPKPADAAKPAEAPKPAEAAKPDTAKPAEAPKPAEAAKADAAAKPADAKADAAKPADAKAAAAKPADAKADAAKPAAAAAAKPDAAKPAAAAAAAKAAPAKRESVGAEVGKTYEVFFKRLRRLARPDTQSTNKGTPYNTDLAYPRRGNKWRRRLRASWILATLASLGWMIAVIGMGRRSVFTSESVSQGHQIFGNKCDKCHVDAFSLHVPDSACLACHDGLLDNKQFAEMAALASDTKTKKPLYAKRWSSHHDNQTWTPACSECHVEHTGHPVLAHGVSDDSCINCHANLTANVTSGAFTTVTQAGRDIRSLEKHAELAILTKLPAEKLPARSSGNFAPDGVDKAQIKLNHSLHLADHLDHMDLTPARKSWLAREGRDHMECSDCHEPDSAGSRMKPIKFDRHCVSCHALGYQPDPVISMPIPHGLQPRVAVEHALALGSDESVSKQFADYVALHPEVLSASPPGPKKPGPKPKPPTPDEWVKGKVNQWHSKGPSTAVGNLIWNKNAGCFQCHTLSEPTQTDELTDAIVADPAKTPGIVPPMIPERWLGHANFGHEKHRVVSCETCHDKARKSDKTGDVLMPPIASCAGCHHKDGASEHCTMCHLYHDRGPDRRDMNGRVPLAELAIMREHKP